MIRFDAPFRPTQPRLNPLAVQTPEIIAWLEAKAPRAIDNWNQIGAEEYARSFVAAQTAQADVIGDLYQGLLDTFRAGGNVKDFSEAVTPVLRAKGWLADDPDELGARVALIYDTNVRVAQAVGQWTGIQRTKQVLPYLRWSAVHDMRTRPSHAACDGLLLPVDHPFWQTHGCPAGFRCRCILSQLSRGQAARRGGVSSDDAVAHAEAAIAADPSFWRYNVGVQSMQAQADAVEQANADRLPGSPPVDVNQAAARGAAIWGSLLGQGIGALISGFLTSDTTSQQ